MRGTDKLFIGNEWVVPSATGTIEVISPHTEQPIARVPAPGPADVDRAVSAARAAFDTGPWPRLDPGERVALVRRLAEFYSTRVDDIAELITTEMGAPLTFSRSAHARLPGAMIRAFADIAAEYPWSESRPGFLGSDVLVCKRPVGVIGAIIPWNMPMFLTVAKLIPALLAGCTIVLKPSPETPLDANLMAELIEQVGLPPGWSACCPATARPAGIWSRTRAWTRCRSPDPPPREDKSPKHVDPRCARSVSNWVANPPRWSWTMPTRRTSRPV